MPTIYLIRHCAAAGQEPDAPLTELGTQQALDLKEFFQAIKIDRILSSDYSRAIASITPLAESKRLFIEEQIDLRERVLTLESREDWFDILRHSFEDPSFKLTGAESGQEAAQRIMHVLKQVTTKETETSIVVTHGNLLTLLLQQIDSRFGFETWRTLSNPDIYRLNIVDNSITAEHVWQPSSCG